MVMRYLVVANQTLGGALLTAAVRSRSQEGALIHIVVPATEPSDDRSSSSPKAAAATAQRRLDEELARCRAVGVEASGAVGAADPLQAIRDAVAEAHYDGLIISTLPAGLSRWLHLDLPHRAVREFGLPVEWVEARDDADEPTTVHIEVPKAAQQNLRGPRVDHQHTPPRQTDH